MSTGCIAHAVPICGKPVTLQFLVISISVCAKTKTPVIRQNILKGRILINAKNPSTKF